ncbi:MAG: MotA/TolQ/ExbB proton channel family protein [Gammaproteobacteria bacterium]|nr:MotA/TolQ/ExbB proton channel family protein [Gammaproteobacteria bacterium]MYF38379.1 MotA/TolQ/ExbB proton channel family protein [Gammaproteobacteria bacterium]
MNKRFTTSFITQLLALVVAVLVVHTFYESVIRPNANVVLEERKEAVENEIDDYEIKRSIYVILKDYEQEICFILMFWAFAIMATKAISARLQHRLTKQDLVKIAEGTSVLPEDARVHMRTVQSLPGKSRDTLLPRAVITALQRFESTQQIQHASEAVKTVCEGEADRLDSELAMIRYISWAIPSIGFIGTVRGIGGALNLAQEVFQQGSIAGVTENLGIAFNSTLVALVISIVIMFFVHQLQRYQEEMVIDIESWCDENLLRHLQVR